MLAPLTDTRPTMPAPAAATDDESSSLDIRLRLAMWIFGTRAAVFERHWRACPGCHPAPDHSRQLPACREGMRLAQLADAANLAVANVRAATCFRPPTTTLW